MQAKMNSSPIFHLPARSSSAAAASDRRTTTRRGFVRLRKPHDRRGRRRCGRRSGARNDATLRAPGARRIRAPSASSPDPQSGRQKATKSQGKKMTARSSPRAKRRPGRHKRPAPESDREQKTIEGKAAAALLRRRRGRSGRSIQRSATRGGEDTDVPSHRQRPSKIPGERQRPRKPAQAAEASTPAARDPPRVIPSAGRPEAEGQSRSGAHRREGAKERASRRRRAIGARQRERAAQRQHRGDRRARWAMRAGRRAEGREGRERRGLARSARVRSRHGPMDADEKLRATRETAREHDAALFGRAPSATARAAPRRRPRRRARCGVERGGLGRGGGGGGERGPGGREHR